MTTLSIEKNKAQNAYRDADKNQKKLLENLFGAETFSQKIQDRVKTFLDACMELAIDPATFLPYQNPANSHETGVNAAAKLFIICRALNGEWVPDWSNESERKYYPWFEFKAGLGFSYNVFGASGTGTHAGSRLCFKTPELAEYAGKQFAPIYNEYLTL